MINYVKVALVIAAECWFLVQQALGQDSFQTPYFPYQTGDILVYHVSQTSERQDDSKLTFVGDSVGENGDRFFFIETEGFSRSVADGFKVDTSGHVYAANWWSGSDYWKVFDSFKEINNPWIAFQSFGGYELGKIIEVLSDETFNVSSEMKRVHIYLGFEDSLATSGSDRNTTRWKSGIGITRKFNFEGGPTYTMKGAVIDGEVYGDTTVYRTPPPETIQKDYFPYQVGDILVYSVTDSTGESLKDSRIEFVDDSVDTDGNTWYTIESEGYEPVVEQFMVDTAKHIYATGWWEQNEQPWKVFDSYFDSDPWIVLSKETMYELGDVRTILDKDWRFNEPQFNYNAIGPIVEVDYYEA